ncbi:NAD(P)/FAD-dependent oxidoreductase [Chitinimonas sp. BJB300]|uniref:NAD(P)/FAD-dependent oxidoreductase n=1 Tax=Chitinimonas sp. BJB300 TaxID=1559339 RepID=UPI000C121A04|nr:NAD(P)/FAD-dependent oxidoreductase [Chitinimonas sp. BJB300]PHV11732.1 FAD-dependent oxidoreductase [Chitinimonas sp. BJB300]TSJ90009.1 NAD(P)/FAD-dependent oxidoreductase [Chitinimonas sp. BJB300]
MAETARCPRIVIVGGGAGGLELATRLGDKLGKKNKAEVILVDAQRTHIWKPLLHQLAAGSYDSHAEEIEYLAQARWHHFRFRQGKLVGLDRTACEILIAPLLDSSGREIIAAQRLAYDYLVLAVGSQTNDFGTPGVQEHAICLDSPTAARHFHERLIDACLRAQNLPVEAGKGRMTVAIIGAGATGVELAAELHAAAHVLTSFGLEHINPDTELKIVLVEASPRILAALPERLSNAAAVELRKLAVEIHSNERVVEVSESGVMMSSGKFIPSTLTVWAAGIKAADGLHEIGGMETNRLNQIVVDTTMRSSGDERIFAFGDCAACPNGAGGWVPARAQVAHQQVGVLAANIERAIAGKPLKAFHFEDYGSLVSLASYSSVGSLMGSLSKGSLFVEGQVAKLMYWSLHKQHQMALSGFFRTMLITLSEWLDRVHRPKIKLH